MTERPLHILKPVVERIEAVRQLRLSVSLRSGLMRWLAGILGILTAAVVSEMLFEFSAPARTAIATILAIFVAGTFVWLVAPPLLRKYSLLPADDDLTLAQVIGRRFPALRDRLVNALQLERELALASPNYSSELIAASFADIATESASLDFNSSVSTRFLDHTRMEMTVAFVLSTFLWVLIPHATTGAFFRLVHFRTEFVPPPAYTFAVSPGNKEVVKGESVPIAVHVTSRMAAFFPQQSELHVYARAEQQNKFDELRLHADSSGQFATTLQNVRASTEYFVRMENVESERFKLTVLDRPVIRSLRVHVDYPAYSRLPARALDEFIGDVTALAGSRITISGTASKDLGRGSMSFGGGREVPLSISGEKFSGSFTLLADDSYRILLTDRERLENLDPVRYRLKVVPDEPPTVSILEPGRNIDIAGNESLNLYIHASDDFGFTSMRLGYRLIKSRYEQPKEEYTYLPIPLVDRSSNQIDVPFTWNIAPVDLVPEDVVEYCVEVFDNDNVRGPKSARSNLYLLRLPSLDEVFSDANKAHEQSIDDLKQSLDDAKKLKEQIDQINQDLKKNKDFDWQKQKQVEEMAKKYQEVQKKLENVNQRLDQMTQQMQQQNVLSKETLEKYMELQQMMQQMNSAELQKALKQMQQSMQNVNKEQLRQALQQMQFSEDRFRQSIERTIDLLKRIQIEQKMDELRKRADELQKLQQELKDESAKAANDSRRQEELAKRQEDLARKQQEMEREADALQKKMEEFFTEMPADKLQKLNEELERQKLDDKMKQAARQMQQGQMQSAQMNQQQIQQQLQHYSEQMDAMQQEMLQKQMQYTINELRKATNNLLELSKREEALKDQSSHAPPNSPQLRQNAQDQLRTMQDLANVVYQLGELSKRSFAVTPEMGKSIGEAMARMQSAMQGLDTRNGAAASTEQSGAMAALNKAASQVQNSLQAMMQGGQGGAGGLLQQLQMLAGQQMSLNARTEQLGQGGMSTQQAAAAARLAQEQAAVQKSLEQLNREAQASGEQKKMLGDLDKIAREMQEVVKNLEQSNINPETIQRQEKILSRLLDAARSMHERDFEKRRKAETGKQVARKSPAEIDPNALNATSKLRQDLLKALEQGYSKDYQELIRKYFEELEKQESVEN